MYTMKLAIFASHLRSLAEAGMNFPAALAWARGLGIEAAEADSGEFAALPPEEYKKVLSEAGMRMISVHHLCRFSAADPDLFEREVVRSIEAAEQAKKAGAEFFMLVPASPQDTENEEEKARARLSIIAGLKRMTEAVTGLIFTIENFSRKLFPFSTAAELCDMADHVPGLKLTLDSGNFRCIAAGVTEGYEAVKNRLAFCHIKDWAVDADSGFPASDGVFLRGCLLGRGVVPVGELMFRLKTDRFGGWLVIEQESAGGSVMKEHIEAAVKLLAAYK